MQLFKEFCKLPTICIGVAAGDGERHKHFAAASVKFDSLNQVKIVIFIFKGVYRKVLEAFVIAVCGRKPQGNNGFRSILQE